ncbi:MAG: TolC family protein, partial [Kiritimatiellia bacterium]
MNNYQQQINPLRSWRLGEKNLNWSLTTILLAGLLIAPGYVIAEDSAPAALDLDSAITQALADNPDLAAQEALTQAARERAAAAAGRRWPALGLLGGYQAYSEDTRLLGARYNGEPGVFASDFIEGALTLKLPLYTGGQLTSEIRGTDLLAQSAEGRLARSRDELIFNVGSLFHTILAQRHVIESVEFSVKAMDEHLKRVNELVAAQKAARVDALRTDVRRAELEQRLIETRNALAIQERALANLLGLEAQPLPQLDGKLELDEPVICPDAADCIAAALEQRTDYRAVQQEASAAEMARRAARGDRLPSVSLSGSYGYRQAVDPAEQPDGTDDAEAIGRVGIVVEFPLFEGGRLSAKVREAEAILKAARQRERSLR